MSRVQFILPALAKLRSSPPTSDAWQFEVKFDGWRAQLHKSGVSSTIFGRNGGDLTHRFPRIAAAVLGLPRPQRLSPELFEAAKRFVFDFSDGQTDAITREMEPEPYDLLEWLAQQSMLEAEKRRAPEEVGRAIMVIGTATHPAESHTVRCGRSGEGSSRLQSR